MKKLGLILTLGIVLRLVLMVTTFHVDIRGHNLAAYLISQKGEVLTFTIILVSFPELIAG